jgi:hypothetical protein
MCCLEGWHNHNSHSNLQPHQHLQTQVELHQQRQLSRLRQHHPLVRHLLQLLKQMRLEAVRQLMHRPQQHQVEQMSHIRRCLQVCLE